jgi:hypothetical protein
MIVKLNRNDRCWCRSGRKFKHCHMDREREKPVTAQEQLQVRRVAFGSKYCLHARAGRHICNSPIIKAHTIQRNGGLSRIARDGQVYGFLPPENTIIKGDKPGAVLTGIGPASTFTGFCRFHDNSTFAPIENGPLQSTPEHTFLITYRVLCKELFLKKATLEMLAKMRTFDRGFPQERQMMFQMWLDEQVASYEAGLRDLEYHKLQFDSALINQDFSQVRYYVVRFDRTPDFMCSGVLQPEYDFQGNLLQDLTDGDAILDAIGFSLIATDTGGAAVFSWLGVSEPAKRLVASLDALPDDAIPDAIRRFAFTFFENLYVSPDWWENLGDLIKRGLIIRTRLGLSGEGKIPKTCLRNDGLHIVEWDVTARQTNVTF